MGWLYKRSLDGFSGPRQYLDARFRAPDGGGFYWISGLAKLDHRVEDVVPA